MSWTFLTKVLRGDILSLVAIIIGVANAPIFESMTTKGDSLLSVSQQQILLLTSFFYMLIFLAVIFLATARYLLEIYCPQKVLNHTEESFCSLYAENGSVTDMGLAINQWEKMIYNKSGRSATQIFLVLFFLVFGLGILTAVYTIYLFGQA